MSIIDPTKRRRKKRFCSVNKYAGAFRTDNLFSFRFKVKVVTDKAKRAEPFLEIHLYVTTNRGVRDKFLVGEVLADDTSSMIRQAEEMIRGKGRKILKTMIDPSWPSKSVKAKRKVRTRAPEGVRTGGEAYAQ